MVRIFIAVFLTLLALTEAREICPAVKTCLSSLRRGKSCPLLPVPKGNLRDPLPEEGFVLRQIRPGVYSYADRFYSTLILYKDRRLTLVDFPESGSSIGPDGEYLLLTAVFKILAVSIPKRIDMVYSHRHLDHIGRAGFVKDEFERTFPGIKIFIWGTSETVEFLRRAEMSRVPEPNVIVGKSGRTVDVAPDLKLRLMIVGGHTNMDLACYIPPSRNGKGVLHFVDIVTPKSVPFVDFGVTIDFGRYVEAQKEVLNLKFDVFSAGHGMLGSKSDIRRNIEYAEFVLKAAANARSEVPPEKFAELNALVANPDAPQFGNSGWVFFQILQLQIDVCVRNTIRRWGCQLTSTDLFAPSHCKEALSFNIIDNQMA